MRSIKELLQLPKNELTPEELESLKKYHELKNVRHSSSFIYHARKLPEEPDGKPHTD